MQNKNAIRLIGGILLFSSIITFVCVIVIILATPPADNRPIAAVPTNTIPAPTPTCTATPPATATPTLKPGDIIPETFPCKSGITLRKSANPPTMTAQEAREAVYNYGWSREMAFGGVVEGKMVTTFATFGLGTYGEVMDLSGFAGITPSPGCENWAGPCNIKVEKCVRDKGCVFTGEVINKIIDRPMWLLYYDNVPYTGSGIPNRPFPTHGRSVVAIDEETGMVLINSGCGSFE